MKFKKWFDLYEMPIRRLDILPNPEAWKKGAKRKYGWSDQDAGILSSESGVRKFKNLWANTEHNYDFYLIRTSEGNKHREVGLVDSEWIKENLGESIEPSKDAITIVFTNNTGAEKVPFTAWSAAHRMGHAFMRTKGHFGGVPEFQNFVKELKTDQENLLKFVYGYEGKYNDDAGKEKRLRSLSHDMGTMRSARQRNLRNYFEFAYELLAQYLLTTNKIQFNEPARMLITYYTWGTPQGIYSRLKGKDAIEIEYMVKNMADYYNELIKNTLDSVVGKIFVM